MVEAGILDGDLVVIRKQDTANTGDIIVALIDDEEATLKASAPPRLLDRPGGRQPRLRDARPRARPGPDPGPPRQPRPPLLKRLGRRVAVGEVPARRIGFRRRLSPRRQRRGLRGGRGDRLW